MYWVGRTIDSGTFHDRALDLIERQIHLGTLRPKERFPPERKLSETLGISRVTLREALKALEMQGLIVALRGARGGTFVGDDNAINAIAQKRLLTRPDLVWRSLEYLRANMVLASMLACERRTRTDLEAIRVSIGKIRSSVCGGDLREAQYDFFARLSQASMNPFLREATETGLQGIFHPVYSASLEELAGDRAERCVEILKAVSDQNREVAAKATSALMDVKAAYIKALMMGLAEAEIYRKSVMLARSIASPGFDFASDPSLLVEQSG